MPEVLILYNSETENDLYGKYQNKPLSNGRGICITFVAEKDADRLDEYLDGSNYYDYVFVHMALTSELCHYFHRLRHPFEYFIYTRSLPGYGELKSSIIKAISNDNVPLYVDTVYNEFMAFMNTWNQSLEHWSEASVSSQIAEIILGVQLRYIGVERNRHEPEKFNLLLRRLLIDLRDGTRPTHFHAVYERAKCVILDWVKDCI